MELEVVVEAPDEAEKTVVVMEVKLLLAEFVLVVLV